MDRNGILVGVAVAMFGAGVNGVALAGQDQVTGLNDSATLTHAPALSTYALALSPGEKPDTPPGPRARGRRQAGLFPGADRHQVGQLKKLQEAMKDQLRLDRQQQEAIDGIFENYYGLVENSPGLRQTAGDGSGAPDGAMELRRRMREAREAGDKETVRKLRGEFRKKFMTRGRREMTNVDELLGKLSAELDKKQRPAMKKLVKKYHVGGTRVGPNRQLRRIGQVVRQPDVGLSAAQRRAVHEVIRKARDRLSKAGGNDRNAARIVEKARADILSELNPKQRVMVEKTLARRGGRQDEGLHRESRDDDQGTVREDQDSQSEAEVTEDSPLDEDEEHEDGGGN